MFTILTCCSVSQVGLGALGVAGAAYGMKKYHDNSKQEVGQNTLRQPKHLDLHLTQSQTDQGFGQQGTYLTWVTLFLSHLSLNL